MSSGSLSREQSWRWWSKWPHLSVENSHFHRADISEHPDFASPQHSEEEEEFQDSSHPIFSSGVFVVGTDPGCDRDSSGVPGEVAVVNASDGSLFSQDSHCLSVESIKQITPSVVSLDECDTGRIHLFDIASDSIVHTMQQGGRWSCGSTYLRKYSLLIAKDSLEAWKLDASYWTQSGLIGNLEIARDVRRCVLSKEEIEPNWVLVGLQSKGGVFGEIYDVFRWRSIGLLKRYSNMETTTTVLEFSPSFGIVTGSNFDRKIRLWDPRTLRETSSVRLQDRVFSLLCPGQQTDEVENWLMVGLSEAILVLDVRRLDQIFAEWEAGKRGVIRSLVEVDQERFGYCSSQGECFGVMTYFGKRMFESPVFGCARSMCYVPHYRLERV